MSQQSQQSTQPIDADMDDTFSVDVPVAAQQPAPARATTTSGRGRGRGRWTRNKTGRVTKPAQQKATSGRGRRHKVYDSPKLQAAHERTQELKQAFAAVVKFVKPAVQEIADRSISELIEDPAVYKQVPEYAPTKSFLRQRLDDTIKQADLGLQYGLAMAEHVWKAQEQKVHEEYTTKVAELCEERYAQLLCQLDTLEYLYDNGLPVDLPASPDERYLYKQITEEDANCQGVFYQTEDGVEVPYSAKRLSELMVKPQALPLEAKRKADGQPEGQPAAKVAAIAKGEDDVARIPRHPAGLLGAVEDIEGSAATTPDAGSSAPTPTPAAEEAARDRVAQRVASAAATLADGPDLPIPRGATDPDEFGVRLISRRPTRLDVPNNRVMVPNLFEWDDLDIGFRDSTNCVHKGATKQRRGKYLGRPGSNYMFVDRKVGIWDSTLAEDDLDEELVKKHKLHPTLGIALPDSVNESEPPEPAANGWKPVVFVPPSGEPIHTSRTIAAARLDKETEEVRRRMEVARMLRTVCEQEGIAQEDVAPDADLVESNRTGILVARGLDPAHVAQPEAEPKTKPSSPTPEPAAEDTAAFAQFVEEAIDAAGTIDAEEEAARMASARRAQPSRPYDAIRDVFTENRSARQPSPPAAQDVSVLADADTSNLSRLADTASQQPHLVAQEPVAQDFVAEEPAVHGQLSQHQPVAQNIAVAEPAHFNQYPPPPPHQLAQNPVTAEPAFYDQPQPNGLMRSNEFAQPQVEYTRPSEYPPPPEYPQHPDYFQPEPAHFTRQDGHPAHIEAARANDFLRTALNPAQSMSPPPFMPVQEYHGVSLAPAPGSMANQAQAPTGRTPFSSTGATKALPALRPMRSLLNEPQAYPEPQGSPAMHHANMMPSNSGAYFPPAASRPFHNGYSLQEPGQPMQPVMSQQQHPLQPHGLAPMGSAPLRPMSPPSQYHHQQPPFGPGPVPMGAQGPMHYQGGPPPLAPAPGPAPRSRPGSSSAAAAANAQAAAASSKYRKLEPAPTPPHRLSYPGNGQELRTVQFDYREQIKDYTPIEAPPRHGPTQIRGWTHNNLRKVSRSATSPTTREGAGPGANPDESSA